MKTRSALYLLTLLSFISMIGNSQSREINDEMKNNIIIYNSKINEIIQKNTQNGFSIIKEEKLPLRSEIDMVVILPLYAGDWYHFSFVGDPSAVKIKATLFLEGYGDLVQDKIIVRRENEFWTEFSFMCPQSGNYELTLYQKAEISRPLSYLTLFKKNSNIAIGTN